MYLIEHWVPINIQQDWDQGPWWPLQNNDFVILKPLHNQFIHRAIVHMKDAFAPAL